ncbi:MULTISPECIES: hypothetical protein [Streptomyces violaceusniger group]|uniref:Uncharacterized protein n=2 Tax=Streptomyces rhizosphaericus TaxID=114699 RepID=A0ABP4CX63_9ACTN|nr:MULTISPECIES: hypothetical protein [Streptomyces violaceusniger group]
MVRGDTGAGADVARRYAAVEDSLGGSFSLEVGGPRTLPGELSGIPRPDWAGTVAGRQRRGGLNSLVGAATASRIEEARTVAGEVLT